MVNGSSVTRLTDCEQALRRSRVKTDCAVNGAPEAHVDGAAAGHQAATAA
jgi:hypothetical protein